MISKAPENPFKKGNPFLTFHLFTLKESDSDSKGFMAWETYSYIAKAQKLKMLNVNKKYQQI